MKINEKNLCAYAVSATPVDKEGYLNKRGEVNKNFQRRYFVLKGNLLFYFEKKKVKKNLLGLLFLKDVLLNWLKKKNNFVLKFYFMGQTIEVMFWVQNPRNPWNNG